MIKDKTFLVKAILQAAEDLKANNINVIDLREINHAVCDWMIVCHGNSSTHLQAIAENIEKTCKEDIKVSPMASEGKRSADWILLDYFDVIVHVFSEDKRNFYDLESVWGDAPQEMITDAN